MQRVVRFSLVGLLTIAGLTACGDKVTVPPPVTQVPPTPVVHSVTVSPGTASVNFLGTFQFTASVDADAGPVKTVTWKTGDATIATVDATGKVTALSKAGTTSVIATSTADASVSGAAVLTVSAAGGGGVVTVSIASINATVCGLSCASVPANQQNFGTAGAPVTTGQLDVVLNVDAGGQVLKSVSATLKCGNDSIVQTETITSSSVAPLSASDASAPVQLSFNTLALNASNVPLLHNAGGPGAVTTAPCTLSASAITAGGTQSAGTSQTIVLNNADVSIVTIATTSEALDPNNLPWVGGGPLTISAIPVMYSGRTPVSATIGLAGGVLTLPTGCPGGGGAGLCNPGLPGAQTITPATAPAPGAAIAATWTNTGTAPTVQGLAVKGTAPTVAITDNSGAVFFGIAKATLTATTPPFTNTLGGVFGFNFDDQKPFAGNFSVLNNPDQNIVPPAAQGYVGAAFRFAADSAAGFRGPNASAGNQTANFDNGAVDKVTTIFQFRVNGVNPWVTVTNTSTIGESVANNTYQLRWITSDALGNADTTGLADSNIPAALTFGVDKTPPVNTLGAAPASQMTNSVAGGNGTYNFVITDNLSGPGAPLVAQVRNWNGLSSVNGANEGNINTNVAAPPGATYHIPGFSATGTQQPCYIGRFNATAAASGANAIPVFSASGAAIGFCTPVVFNLAGGAVSSDFGGVDGYWTTTVVAQDVAANQTTPFTRTVLQDVTAPTITNIDLPPTATGNATVGFPATVTDNAGASVGDIIASWISINYAGVYGGAFRYPNTTGPGVAFDNVLTNSTVATPTIPNFAKTLQTNDGASAASVPVPATENATSVTITAQGAALNTGSLTANFAPGLPQLVAGTSPVVTWPNGLTAGWSLTGNNATLSNCPAAGCTGGAAAANPLAVSLTATAKGATATFANPLVGGAVGIWYRVTGQTTFFFAGNAAAGVSRDDGVNRFWDYTFTFDPPVSAPDGTVLTVNGTSIDIVAIGVNANGDAIMGPVKTVILSNP